MNKIIRKEMLAGELPEALRGDIDPSRTVKVTVEDPAVVRSTGDAGHFSRFYALRQNNFSDDDEVVQYVRSLRDEWG